MNRVQLLVTRGEGVAVQNSQVSVFKGMGESNTGRRRVANQVLGVPGLWHREVRRPVTP